MTPMLIKGKLETTFVWTCECGIQNTRLDDQHCQACGKQITTEQCQKHYKLIPEPIRVSQLMKI